MMKNLKIFYMGILLLLAFISISCEKTVISSDNIVEITGHIEDIIADEGVGLYTFNLDETYIIKNESNALPENTVYANSNPTLVRSEILDYQLLLYINSGETGSAEITIRSRFEGFYRDDVFTVTISAISATLAMERAINYFTLQDYELAESHFKLVVTKNETALLSDAYMGLGYSRMRLGSEAYSWGYLDLKTSSGLNPANVDALAGISLLEYAINENYAEAISLGTQTLAKDNNFVFRYDNTLDKNDIRLNIALSQYAAQLFDDCLKSIQLLDPSFVIDPSANDYKTRLYEKLQQLVELYK